MSEVVMKPLDGFFSYARERYLIMLRKNQGLEKPWTADEVLLNYRFCNIFREDDTVTIWVKENIREPFQDSPNLVAMLCAARIINWPDTLAEMIASDYWFDKPGFSLDGLAKVMQERQDRGDKVYTGAYMIRAENDPRHESYNWTKHEYICRTVIGAVYKDVEEFNKLIRETNSLEKVWDHFQQPKFRGWGLFLVYEVITDFSEMKHLRNATDVMTWANPGPGAMRGLNRIQGRNLDDRSDKNPFIQEMQLILEASKDPANWPANWPTWNMRTVEHTLCEFDKKERVRLNEGRPRSKYSGNADGAPPKRLTSPKTRPTTTQNLF